VVAKLFNIVKPHNAYFGQKDAQQAIVIKQMVRDLNMDLKIKVLPIVREKSGLAMSSRNMYLSSVEKKDAPILNNALQLARRMIKSSTIDSKVIVGEMYRLIQNKKTAKVEYIKIVDPASLGPVKKIKHDVLIAVAVRIGKTRLIDNAIVKC
ncbi:MAG: pantoate--beta-alanine ligase, partial [Candidatus Omnitrophota bacterium]